MKRRLVVRPSTRTRFAGTRVGRVVTEPSTTRENATSSEQGILLRGITKRFGSHEAVSDVDLEVYRGEFFTMLGPSVREDDVTATHRGLRGSRRRDDLPTRRRRYGYPALPARREHCLPGLRPLSALRCRPERGLRSQGSTREAH